LSVDEDDSFDGFETPEDKLPELEIKEDESEEVEDESEEVTDDAVSKKDVIVEKPVRRKRRSS
ncbi:MAG: hypothetical protein OQL19_04050, partial [Gammaproteobacteria bacterium]|nr:hypothetical protein [Gammaproteobacteria bacterium]